MEVNKTKTKKTVFCYKCGKIGHFSNVCSGQENPKLVKEMKEKFKVREMTADDAEKTESMEEMIKRLVAQALKDGSA